MNTPAHEDRLSRLEPRHLFAQANSFTDADGDQYTVKVTGPGAFVVVQSAGATGFIDSLTVTGTDSTSALSISVKKQSGDGRLRMVVMTAATLKSFSAPAVDVSGAEAKITTGPVKSMSIGDVTAESGDTTPVRIIGGTDADRTSIQFRNMVRGSLAIDARVTSLKGGQTLLSIWNLTRGADKITIASDLSVQFNTSTSPAFPVAVGSLKCGFLSTSAVLRGAVGTVDAANIGDGTLEVFGPITSLRSRGDSMATDITAYRIGTFNAADAHVTGNVVLFTTDANGVMLNSYRAKTVTDAFVSFGSKGAVPGFIRSMAIESADGLVIHASGIGSLRVKGDLLDCNLALGDGVGLPFAIKTGVIGGAATGDWTFASPIGSLRFGRAGQDGDDTLSLDGDTFAASTIGSFSVTGAERSFFNIRAATIGALSAKHDIFGEFLLTNADATGVSIKNIQARLLEVQINETTGNNDDTIGGIGVITAQRLQNSLINTRFLKSLKLISGDAADGEMSASTIRCTGADAGDFSLRTATLAGRFDDSNVLARRDIDRISARLMTDTVVQAGLTSVNYFSITTLAAYTAGMRINQITLTGPFSLVERTFNNSYINTPVLGQFTLNGAAKTDNGGDPHGLAAGAIDKVTLRDLLGTQFSPTLANGANTPLGLGTDFVIKLLV